MSKLSIVSKQWHEEFYIYGVFSSKDTLDVALNELAQSEIEEAKKDKQELQSWFDDVHTPWAKRGGIEPTKLPQLDMDIIEYSKSLFDVFEIEADEVILSPKIMP